MKLVWALILAGLAWPVLAQERGVKPEPVWYQVELLIFRYLDLSGETESWPALPELRYPPHLRHLNVGLPTSDLHQQYELRRIEDTAPAPAFDLAWDKSIAELMLAYANSLVSLDSDEPPPTLEAVADDDPAALDPMSVTVPRAFASVAEDAREFSAQALRIRRSRDMRVLFHESWLQPLRDREFSLPVVVDSVIEHDDYPALQGSLLLYVSRYLHVETNLWLNTGEASTSEVTPAAETGAPVLPENAAHSRWAMPPPPLPPKPYNPLGWAFRVSLDAGFSDDLVLPAASRDEFEPGRASDNFNSAAARPIVAYFDPAPGLQPIEIRARRMGVLDIDRFLGEVSYPYQQAILVQQQRRMRGGEIHYLDHPAVGIIVRVTPYEFEPFFESRDITGGVAGNAQGLR